MALLKKILLGLLALLVVLVLAGYFVLRSIGIISRADYDHEVPVLPEFERPAVLVLSKANGFVHVDALPAGEQMLRDIADINQWDLYATDNAATHNADDLARFKVVVWNNVSGDVLTEAQRAALKNWIESGGAWVGIHASGGDLSYQWDWYVQSLIGAQFAGHTSDPHIDNLENI